MTGVSIRHRLEYAAVRLGVAAFGFLPEGSALALGAGVGWTAGRVFRIRMAQVHANLTLAFPEADEDWIRRIALGTYRHFGREIASTVRLAGATREDVLRRTEVVGLDQLRSALEEGRGVVLATGHLGNLEVGAAALTARGIPFMAVARHQRNPLSDLWMRRTRERFGMRILPKMDAARDGGAMLAEGTVLALPADQDARIRGVFVDFFGRAASTPAGPAVLALRYRAPLFVGVSLSHPTISGHYRVLLRRIVPDLARARAGRVAVTALTASYTRVFEAWVRSAPEQYFWMHRRWKTPPPSGTDPIGAL